MSAFRMADLLIHGGTIVTANRTFDASLLIDKGRIVSVSKSAHMRARSRVNAKGLYILPGLIDTHVHFRDPGMTHKEDFVTGTRSAAKGGVTTILDMPTNLPTVTSRKRFLEKLNAVKTKSIVDFGLYAGASVANLPGLHDLAETGAIAFKSYMVAPPPERAYEYEGTFVTDTASLYRLMEGVRAVGGLLCLHAECDSIVRYLTERLKSEGRRDALAHAESRPQFSETEAVSEALLLSESVGTRVHLLHLSARGAVDLLRYWKKNGSSSTAETCPQYLFLTKETLRQQGPYAKCNPPLRDESDRKALWKGISDGTIDIVASDHAPHSKAEKDAGVQDIWKAPAGMPGVETRLPLLLTEAARGRIRLQDIVRLCATRPAEIFGLYPKKGQIAIGSDADLVLVDLDKEWILSRDQIETKGRETFVFEGWQVKGKVVATYLRGNLVVEEDKVLAKPGSGEFVKSKRLQTRAQDSSLA